MVMKKKLTKNDIEKIAKEIRHWAATNRIYDYSLLYNGKWWHKEYVNNRSKVKIDEDKDPHKWCEYFPEKFILGITADGSMYDCLNGYNKEKAREKLYIILQKYGLYLECADYCYWYASPINDIEEIEYTYWLKEKIIYLYGPDRSDSNLPIPTELNLIMTTWYELAKEIGDKGCCTIGEYMEFRYKGIKYRMSSQSPYQGDYSWSVHVPKIKEMLNGIGATDIYMNYGRMD
jgi:hypothetical protein